VPVAADEHAERDARTAKMESERRVKRLGFIMT